MKICVRTNINGDFGTPTIKVQFVTCGTVQLRVLFSLKKGLNALYSKSPRIFPSEVNSSNVEGVIIEAMMYGPL